MPCQQLAVPLATDLIPFRAFRLFHYDSLKSKSLRKSRGAISCSILLHNSFWLSETLIILGKVTWQAIGSQAEQQSRPIFLINKFLRFFTFNLQSWKRRTYKTKKNKKLRHSYFLRINLYPSIFSVRLSEGPDLCGILSPEICPKPNKTSLDSHKNVNQRMAQF